MSSSRLKRRKIDHGSNNDGVPSHGSDEDLVAENGNPLKSTKHAQNHARARRSASKAWTDQLLLSGSSYRSSLLKLQLDDLLSGITINHQKRIASLEPIIRRLDELLRSIPEKAPLPLSEAEKRLRKTSGVEIPFPQPRPGKDTKYLFAFQPPVNVNVVRGLALKTELKTKEITTVDVAVTLPASLFQEKDYLNHRYFYKRAYYLACIGAGLQDAALDSFKLSYGYLDGNQLQPTLLIEAGEAADSGFSKSRCRIQIIPAIDDDVFPIRHTLPKSNCVRSSDASNHESSGKRPSSPFYNAALRSEASIIAHLKLLQNTSQHCDGFRDSCILGSLWLRQRGLASDIASGGFGNIEWAICCALLLEDSAKGKSVMSTRYTSYQLFKAMLQFLAGKNLVTPFFVHTSNVDVPPSNKPVFYDGRTGMNILFKMQPWTYELLKDEASMSLSALNDRFEDTFRATFITRVDVPLLRYDYNFVIPVSEKHVQASPQSASEALDRLYGIITRALEDRVRRVHFELPKSTAPNFSKKIKGRKSSSELVIQIVSHEENASRLVDHGPTAEDTDAAEDFRRFWGEKAELRRFKDGSISESLVWSEGSVQAVFLQILELVLKRHFAVNDVQANAGVEGAQAMLFFDSTSSKAANWFANADNSFKELINLLTQLEGMPLAIRSIVPSNSLLSNTSIQTPPIYRPAEILLQFEGSNRWPDHMLAIQRTKIAFLSKLAELMEATELITSARLGLENESNQLLNQAFLDIWHTSGKQFRIRIHHEREQILLERSLKSKALDGRARDETAQALAAYKRQFLQASRHTQAIKSLCTRYPAFSTTVRLVKRWCNAHMLSHFLREELIELFVAHTFLCPYPWKAPSSPSTGFLRTIFMLSEWDWEPEPMILNLNNELTTEDVDSIKNNFAAWRKVDPAMNTVTLFVGSNLDHSGVTWTQFARPPRVVAARLSSLARAAMEVVRSSGLHLDFTQLFKSPLTDFDFLLHIKPSYTTTVTQRNANHVYKNLRLSPTARSPEADGLEAVHLFVDDLRAVMGENALFFYDEDGGAVVGGLWNPRSLGPRPWKIRLPFSSRPVSLNAETGRDGQEEGEGLVVEINRAGILAEIGLLGEGLIDRIEVLREV